MVYLVSDHGGWKEKKRLALWLNRRGIVYRDIGPHHLVAGDDYTTWSARLCRILQRQPDSTGIALCRSGVGMAMVANKFRGIRAAQAWSPAIARRARQDEDANFLSLAADFHTTRDLQRIVTAWLNTPYLPKARYQRRLRAIKRFDHGR